MIRRLALGTTLVLAFLIIAPPAGAAVMELKLVCDGEVATLTIGGGLWSAAHIAETGDVFVPVATHVYLRDPATGKVVKVVDDYKGTPRTGGTTCVDPEEFVTKDGLLGTFVVEGDVR